MESTAGSQGEFTQLSEHFTASLGSYVSDETMQVQPLLNSQLMVAILLEIHLVSYSPLREEFQHKQLLNL